MANTDFKKFMAPDFQAQSSPALDWMPWEDPQQQGADLGGVLGQLKPKMQMGGGANGALPYEGNMLPTGAGGLATGKSGGGKGSL